MHPTPRCAAFTLAIFAFLTLPASGQVPDGWIVVSTFKTMIPANPPFPGDGGLWLLHPRSAAGPVVPIGGLGPDLTGAGLTLGIRGANSVLRRSSDGALLVGETDSFGGGVHLHLLQLTGASVATDTTFFCGNSNPSGSGEIVQIALLPSGEALVAVAGLTSGPLANAHLGRVHVATGAVTPIPVLGLESGSRANALALDSTGTLAYVGVNKSGAGSLWSVPVPGGGMATKIAPLPGIVTSLALDNGGGLLVGCNTTGVFQVDPATGAVTDVGVSSSAGNAVAVERVTGSYLVNFDDVLAGGSPPSIWISLVEHAPSGTIVTPLAPPPPGGWGVISGVDVNHDPETFGPASPGASTYTWALAPNPGGLPLLGSSSFSLTLESNPASGAPGVALVCLGAFDPPLGVLGVLLNVDVTKTVVTKTLLDLPMGLSTETIPLPIPSIPTLPGTEVFVQSGHLEPGGLAASSGVRLTILL